MDDNQVAILSQYGNMDGSREGENVQWQNGLTSVTANVSISENSKNDQREHSPDQKDFDFIRKHAGDADPDFIYSLLESQVDNPKRLEAVCEMLDIPNASFLIEEFKRNSVKPGEKRSVIEPNAQVCDSKKQKKSDQERYLKQVREMFPDADGLFLISECQRLESEDDFSRFVNTVMLSGVYPKQECIEVNCSSTQDFPKVVDIVDKEGYRTTVNYSSEEETSSSELVDSPQQGSLVEKSENKFLGPPIVDVIELSSDNTESYDPPDLDLLQEVLAYERINAGEAMEVEEITPRKHSSLDDDIDQLLLDKFGSGEPNPSCLNNTKTNGQTLADGTVHNAEKSLAEIIEDNRSNRQGSIASFRELGPSTSKDTKWANEMNEVSNSEVSTTSQPKPEVEVSVEEDISEMEWIDEQTANLIRIFPNADPSYLREEVVKMYRSPEAVNEFVVNKLEKNDLPTKAEYDKKREMEELQNRYTKNFSIEDFLRALPDPWKYFSDVNRNCAKYKDHSLCYLKSNFRKHYVRDILQAFTNNNKNLYLTYKALEKQEAKARNSRRSDFECDKGRPTTIDVQFLQEVAFIENEKKIKEYLEAEKIARQIKFDEAKRSGSLLECQCCFDAEVLVEDMFYCPKDHAFCRDCMIKSVEVEIGNGKYQFECLSNCNEKFTLACLQNAIKPELFSKVIQAIQMEEIRAAGIEDLVQCPFCNYATIMPPEQKVMVCLNPECLKESCRLCKELNHVPLRCEEVEKSEEVKIRTYIENKMTEALVRTCHKCGKKFVKEDGCNKMTCTCGARMCYVCRKPVSGYSHFNAQGGTEYHKCPLYSMNDELHVELVKRVAEEAKAEILQANPQAKLIHDPTIVMPERSNQKPIPGINNGLALDVAMRAIRGDLNAKEENKKNRVNRNKSPPGEAPPRNDEGEYELESDSDEEDPNPRHPGRQQQGNHYHRYHNHEHRHRYRHHRQHHHHHHHHHHHEF